MGIFVGRQKESAAVLCALNINYAFCEIIKPRLETKYPALATHYDLAHYVELIQVRCLSCAAAWLVIMIWYGRPRTEPTVLS